MEIINDSTGINWPKNRTQQQQQQQQHNHYRQQQQQKGQPQQHIYTQQQEQQHQLQLEHQQHHYGTINPNSSTEQFDVIDENERHGRTFTFITDFINSFTQPTCYYPCTLEAYQQRRCCETVVVVPQPPPNVCCQQPMPPLQPPPGLPMPQPPVMRPPTVVIRPPQVIPPPPPLPPPQPSFPLIPTQCCNTCPSYGYYGPPPCIRYTIPAGGPGRISLYIPSPPMLG